MSSYRLGSMNGPQFTVKYKPENSEKKVNSHTEFFINFEV